MKTTVFETVKIKLKHRTAIAASDKITDLTDRLKYREHSSITDPVIAVVDSARSVVSDTLWRKYIEGGM